MIDPTNQLYSKTREEWRYWLLKNHLSSDEIWMLHYKKHTGKGGISYDDAVEEALCFGWIDGKIRSLNDEKYIRRFTPRRKRSIWSELNKKRAKKMIKAGLMTEAGMEKVKEAKRNGQWEKAYPQPVNYETPEYFIEAMNRNKIARKNYEALSPSHKKQYVAWIMSAKQEETRLRRTGKAIKMLMANQKPGMM